MLRWTCAILGPVALVYLLTSHPYLTTGMFFGFSAADVLGLHAAMVVLTAVLALLFSRSRSALVGALSLAFVAGFSDLLSLGTEPLPLALAYLGAGLVLVAGPEKRLFRLANITWIGAAVLVAVGLLTLAEISPWRSTPTLSALALACWGAGLLYLRTKKASGRTELYLTASLVGLAFLGWTVAFLPDSFSDVGFHVVALGWNAASLFCVVEHSFRLAYIDELTEIPGRRALMEALDDPGQTFTLAMLDVDHFKKFNDTHGHDVGDQVLRMVAARISTVKEGAAYRYGGEEFTLLFPGKSLDEVTTELERIRGLVESSPLVLRSADRPKKKPKNPVKKASKNPSVGVTVSIGVATRKPSETWEKVMKRADQALYKAKEGGRNQVAEAS